MNRKIAIVFLLAAFTLPAAAEGFYVLGDVGQSKSSEDFGNHYFYEDHETTYSLGVGYDVNKNFAFELAYSDMGTNKRYFYDARGANINYSAFTGSVLAKYPVSEKINVYGRLGLGKVTEEIDGTYNNASYVYHYRDTDSQYRGFAGLGVSYDLTDKLALRTEYNQFAKFHTDTTLSALTVGATFKF